MMDTKVAILIIGMLCGVVAWFAIAIYTKKTINEVKRRSVYVGNISMYLLFAVLGSGMTLLIIGGTGATNDSLNYVLSVALGLSTACLMLGYLSRNLKRRAEIDEIV